MQALTWIIARLKEASTWRGIIGLIAAAGVAVSPEQTEGIVAAGVALVAAIELFRKEQPK